jgi:hypothetical protein
MGILCGKMLVPQNMVKDLNNVMYVLYIYKKRRRGTYGVLGPHISNVT